MEVRPWAGHHKVSSPYYTGPAYPVSSGSGTPLGSHALDAVYPAGSSVLCCRSGKGVLILGICPEPVYRQSHSGFPDFLVPAAGGGLVEDRLHQIRIRKSGSSGIGLAPMGRNADHLPGDSGAINEYGVGYGVNRLFSWLRASHTCFVRAWAPDNLLHLFGYNFRLQTASQQVTALNDQGEYSWVDQLSPYPWESVGLKDPGDFTTAGVSGWKNKSRASREPLVDDQAGFWRSQIFRGYLGDLYRHTVATHNNALPSPHRLSQDASSYVGLFDQTIGPDGYYMVRTARGIRLEKYVRIPVPKQKAEADEGSDDSDDVRDGYSPAGKFGDGTHARHAFQFNSARGSRPAQSFDAAAYMANVSGFASLTRHTKDWQVPEEADVPLQVKAVNTDAADPDAFWMAVPTPQQIWIDHRDGMQQVPVYSGRSYFELMDDGSVIMGDAWGSEIQMTGGNIVISPRQDLVLAPGRSLIGWAGQDAVIRARKHVDVSSSKGDVSVKAEHSIKMLSANDERGGILLESRASSSTGANLSGTGPDSYTNGIILKAPTSRVASFSQQLYLRTGVEAGQESSGEIHIDSGRATGTLTLSGSSVTARARDSVRLLTRSQGTEDFEKGHLVALDLTPSQVSIGGDNLGAIMLGADTLVGRSGSTANLMVDGRFSSLGGAFVGQGMEVLGSIRISGTAAVRGQVQAGGALINGSMAVRSVAARVPAVGELPNDFTWPPAPVFTEPQAYRSRIDDGLEEFSDRVSTALSDVNAMIHTLYETENQWGHQQLIDRTGFSFRTSEQFHASDMVIYQFTWQRMNEQYGPAGNGWDEPVVLSPTGTETRPHPGQAVWSQGKHFGKIEPLHWNWGDSPSAISRQDSEQLDPRSSDMEKVTMLAGYTVTSQDP